MKKILPALAFLLSFAVTNAQQIDPNSVDGQIYVKLKDSEPADYPHINGNILLEVNQPYFSSFYEKYGITHIRKSFYQAFNAPLNRVYRIYFSKPEKVQQFIDEISAQPAIEYAERVPLYKTDYQPNDLGANSLDQQWHLYMINAAGAWDISRGDKNITVAIVDDALYTGHPDLKDNVWINPLEIPGNGIDDDLNGYIDDINGWDAGDQDNNPSPLNTNFGHGTHVGGISGAVSDNNIGVASIGSHISLIGVKCTENAQANATAIPYGYEGITYAVNARANIINCSWSGPQYSQTGQLAVTYAYQQGILVIAAAGNNNTSARYYPAAFDHVLAVGSTDNNDRRSYFSNFGSYVDVSAPGERILSTTPFSAYKAESGTSMASPLVAGLTALMLSHHPGLTLTELQSCLLSTTDSIDYKNSGYKGQLGSGRINAKKAMECADSKKANPSGGNKPALLIYPNPVTDYVNILPDSNVLGKSIRLHDVTGKILFNSEISSTMPFSIDMTNYSQGVYFLSILTDKQPVVYKLVKATRQ